MRIIYKCSSQTPATYLCNRYIVATNLNSDAELYSIELLTINIQKPKLFPTSLPINSPTTYIPIYHTIYLSLPPKPAGTLLQNSFTLPSLTPYCLLFTTVPQ